MQEAAKSFAQNHGVGFQPKWVLLVGVTGPDSVIRLPSGWCWQNWMNALSKAGGALVGHDITTHIAGGGSDLRQHLNPEALARCLVASEGRAWCRLFLGLADAVVVTADSMTMVTEAIGSELPAIVLSVAKGSRMSGTNQH